MPRLKIPRSDRARAGEEMTAAFAQDLQQARERAVGTTGWGRHPELVDSLKLLVEVQHYTLSDVALMFGVSRERVRQWCLRDSIRSAHAKKGGLHHVRVWNDTTNMFEPQSRGALNDAKVGRIRATQRKVREAETEARRSERWARAESVMQTLVATYDRAPTVHEAIAALGLSSEGKRTGDVGRLWGYLSSDHKMSFREVWQRLCVAAGVVPRNVGSPGHVENKQKQRTHCQVHKTPLNSETAYLQTHRGKYTTWVCRMCRQVRRARSRKVAQTK